MSSIQLSSRSLYSTPPQAIVNLQKINDEMPSLGTIEADVLCLIFDQVEELSPHTLQSLALVNRYFYATLRLLLHRRKTLEYSSRDHQMEPVILTTWLQDDNILRGLRHLTIDVAKNLVPEMNVSKWENLVTFIEKLHNLRCLTWNHDWMIPLEVLEALHKHHPQASLRIFQWTRPADIQQNWGAELVLTRSRALTAIRANILKGYDRLPDLRIAAFRRIVANARNLKFASLTAPSTFYYRAGDREEQARLEALFAVSERPNPSVRRLTLDGFDMSEETLKSWGKVVDLSKLEDIKISRGNTMPCYFHYALQTLTSIKHVSLNLGNRTQALSAAVENYLSSCPPLETLSLWSWMDSISLESLLSRHGSSLVVLQLHEREWLGIAKDDRRRVLSASDIQSIRESCPKLRDLTLDRNRHTESLETEIAVDEGLQELAKMKLSKLQLYYDIGIASTRVRPSNNNDQEVLAPPTETQMKTFAVDVWKLVFGSQTLGQRCLEVKFGEWERRMWGDTRDWLLFESRSKRRIVIAPNERDDKLAECSVQCYSVPDPEEVNGRQNNAGDDSSSSEDSENSEDDGEEDGEDEE